VRPGVLDVGSDTVHLVVGAYRGKAERQPAVVASLPFGAALLSRGHFHGEPPGRRMIGELSRSAMRKGVILGMLGTLDGTAQIDRSAQDASERLGRLTTFEARCTG
jgi:hypothetical protein